MKVTLKAYNDLGTCAYATLMDEFDSEKDEIFLDDRKIEIGTIDDLFRFLWNIPGVACRDNVSHTSVAKFYTDGTWWEHRYDESIKLSEEEINKLERRLEKASTSRKEKLQDLIEIEREHVNTLRRTIKRLNVEMEERKEMIRHENGM